MRNRMLGTSVFVLACLFAGAAAAQVEQALPKNIIVMISDGCGYNHIAATGLFCEGKADAAVYHTFDVKLAMSTFPANGSYEPDKAWQDFDYVKANYTDSAAAATALATGVKTNSGVLGMDAKLRPVPNVVERAESLGKATGVVSSVLFTSATPAGFVVHNKSRNDFGRIGADMVLKSEVDVIMGAGHPLFDGYGRLRPGGDFQYIGAPGVWWNTMREGKAGADVDADHNGIMDDVWTAIETREQFQELATGPAPKRVFGLARVPMATQQERPSDRDPGDDLPDQVPFIESVPTLSEMTAGALNVLDDDPDGFFLMIEGGAVDLAGHRNQAGRMIEEQRDFDQAAKTVVEWVEANSSWTETLVIVTADHETGYLTVEKTAATPIPWASLPLTVEKAGDMPKVRWNSGQHTNSLVPLYAKGAGANQLPPRAAGTDPKRGPYIDNTAVGQLVFHLWQ